MALNEFQIKSAKILMKHVWTKKNKIHKINHRDGICGPVETETDWK